MSRIIKRDVVRGTFGFPIGIKLFDRPTFPSIEKVEVSTVCVEGAHLEDPLSICSAEHGYETAVFLDGCSLFSIFAANYDTKEAARRGHARILRRLLAGKLPLSIELHYYAFEVERSESKAIPNPQRAATPGPRKTKKAK